MYRVYVQNIMEMLNAELDNQALAMDLECRSLLLGPCTPGTTMHNHHTVPEN